MVHCLKKQLPAGQKDGNSREDKKWNNHSEKKVSPKRNIESGYRGPEVDSEKGRSNANEKQKNKVFRVVKLTDETPRYEIDWKYPGRNYVPSISPHIKCERLFLRCAAHSA
jgi:hypothetical protein